MVSLMSIECVKVLLIIYGSGMPEYYTYHHHDGYAALRYVSHPILIDLGVPYNGASSLHLSSYIHIM